MRVRNPTTATNSVAPMIDHITGNDTSPAWNVKISGRLKKSASPIPINAPINPITIYSRHPPRLYPEIACPMEPHTPAIISKMINSTRVMIFDYIYGSGYR